jgi:hypothetical protein
MITKDEWMGIGVVLIKVAIVCFLGGILVGWLIFK